MNQLINSLRWLVFLPAGMLAGLVASVALGVALGMVLGGWWPTACLAAIATALVQPLVGYHVGTAVAPERNKLARVLMKAPYSILGGSAALAVLVSLGGGSIGNGPCVLFPALSAWAFGLCHSLGTVYGACVVLDQKPPEETAPTRESDTLTTFDWSRTTPIP